MSEPGKTAPAQQEPRRRPYQAPLLGRVSLAAEQVLFTGCKGLTFGSAAGSIINCIGSGCADIGT